MNKEYLTKTCESIGFPSEAVSSLEDAFSKLEPFEICKKFEKAEEIFINQFPDNSYMDILDELSKQADVHIYTVNMLFVIYCTKNLHKKYKELGRSEDLADEAMEDIPAKLTECYLLHKVWGTFVLPWFRGIFRGTTVKLGRLQYNIVPFEYDDYKGIKKGDMVYSCHIPSTGPMTRESVLDSLDRAYDFFEVSGTMHVFCHSWLLYPPHRKLFPDGSNLANFYDLFEIFYEEEPNNNDLWRVFSVPNDTDPNTIVAKTGLQKRMLEFLKAGNKMGVGCGLIFYKKGDKR